MSRKPETIDYWRGRLPHWEVKDGRYFVTIHLAGAIPREGKERIRKLRRQLGDSGSELSPEVLQLQRKIFAEMERWLDVADYKPLLSQPEIAEVIIEAIEDRHRRRVWNMFDFVVMPNHVHLFFELPEPGLKKKLRDFKRWTGGKALEFLPDEDGMFWQREWFDHWSRSEEQDDQIVEYIRDNPVKARLVEHPAEWPYAPRDRATSRLQVLDG